MGKQRKQIFTPEIHRRDISELCRCLVYITQVIQIFEEQLKDYGISGKQSIPISINM
jgi:hypothetical protein